ncbi:MAG TPA: PEP-CTERM sorting domain-containing protein [Fimbriiglobus sp.]|nr:PEP-CTERM sorting domain-containing protein [Fimbriiglobus sp.]
MRVLLAAVALFALSATADAGSIWFAYRIEAQTTPAGGGAGEFVIRHGPPDGGWVDQATRPSADLASLWLRPAPPIDDPDWRPGFSNIVSRTTAFEVTVSLTDRASGLGGEATFTGTAGSQWMHRWDGLYRGEGTWIDFDGSQSQELTLGRHVFTIEAEQAFDPRDAEVQASIALSGAPVVPNPEPGTLLLGGLGLVVAGIARRRW